MSTPSAPPSAPEQSVQEILDGASYVADLDRKRDRAAARIESLLRGLDMKDVADADLARLAGSVWSTRAMVEIRERSGPGLIVGVTRMRHGCTDAVGPNLLSKDVIADPTACARAVVAFKERFGDPEKGTAVTVDSITLYIRDFDVDAVTARLIALYA